MRILIADDSLLSRRLLEETLRTWGYDVVAGCDGEEAWQILNGPDPPSVAILDWMMPGYSGPDVCRMVRAKGSAAYTYILLLTSRNEREDVVEGMDAGADDYIAKPFDRHELKVRLRAGVRIVELQNQLLSTSEALRMQATHDYLTGLWNRSAILDILRNEMARSARESTHVAVALADLDHFKSINDTYGHGVGDIALKEAAQRMQASIRHYDAIGRYGGEEFLAVLPGVDEHGAWQLADRMRRAINGTPLIVEGDTVRFSCSFGCAATLAANRSAEELIRIADAALYQAKGNGRDAVVVRCADDVIAMAAAVDAHRSVSNCDLEMTEGVRVL